MTAQLHLDHADYALNPEELSTQRKRTQRALREVVAYRLFVDLERGWRVTMPNLEQTGLIRIDYADLDELSALEKTWTGTCGPLRTADPQTRAELIRILLDEMRRVLAIDVECLTDLGFEEMSKLSRQLKDPWALAERERMVPVGAAFARSGKAGGSRSDLNLSGRSRFGRHLRRPGRFPAWTDKIDTEDAQQIITDLLHVLANHGLITEAVPAKNGGVPGYRINAAVIIWGQTASTASPIRCAGSSTASTPARASTRSSATSTRSSPGASRACSPASTPRRFPATSARTGSGHSARRSCRCCTAPHDGARCGHRRAQRGDNAERPADPGQLRAAQRTC